MINKSLRWGPNPQRRASQTLSASPTPSPHPRPSSRSFHPSTIGGKERHGRESKSRRKGRPNKRKGGRKGHRMWELSLFKCAGRGKCGRKWELGVVRGGLGMLATLPICEYSRKCQHLVGNRKPQQIKHFCRDTGTQSHNNRRRWE